MLNISQGIVATHLMHSGMFNDFIANLLLSLRYGDSVGNTVEENFSVSSLIRMCWLPSARACGQ